MTRATRGTGAETPWAWARPSRLGKAVRSEAGGPSSSRAGRCGVPHALLLTVLTLAAGATAGCDLFVGRVVPVPFGGITAVQLFEEPNFTVAFSVESAVGNASALTRVNWVFGDGGGFVEGAADRATTTHQYPAPGTYEVTAFLFDSRGFVDQITSTIRVQPNPGGTGPGPDETPAVLPDAISGPMPADGAEDVPVDTMLTWLAGAHSDSHNVYLGTVRQSVEDADESTPVIFQGNQTETFFVPDELLPDTQYFWRVDEVNAGGVTRGTVMRFTTFTAPGRGRDFVPADGVTSMPVGGVLQWTAGKGAISHDVYFGRNESAVTAATRESQDIFQGNQTATTFDPQDDDAEIEGELLPGTLYFWRVDAVGLGGTTKGTVRHFTTSPLPPRVFDPIPADEALEVDILENLSWSASPDVESFDVYLGRDDRAIAGATPASPEFLGNTTANILDPGPLVAGQDYFWRVDTLGPGGRTHGEIFTFTTTMRPPRTVGHVPADDASNVPIEAVLEWDADPSARTTSYEVYLSTRESEVLNAAPAALQGMPLATGTTPETFDPGDLDPDTIYFWRVDAVGAGGSTTGTVLTFRTAALPEPAGSPTPANGERGVALDAMLEWTADTVAPSYDVYLGKTQSLVQDADTTSAVFQSNVSGTSFTPGMELDGDTTYFWRIDARSPGGVVAGEVWSFTTAPARPTAPRPERLAKGVDVNTGLTWTHAGGADSFDVYLGTNRSVVETATPDTKGIFRGNVTDTNFEPDTLSPMTPYYWRIDTLGAAGTTKGEIWEFATGAAQAADPAPADGATGVPLLPILDWTPDAANATAQDIYFGMNQATVSNADHTSPAFQGTFDLATGPPPFNPGALQGMTLYYWRIDSVSVDGTTKGEVWQFRTGPGKATGPMPAHFTTDVSITTTLSWTAGDGAVSHEIYLGTSEAAVANSTVMSVLPDVTLFTTAGTILDPGPLSPDTTYYWRVDSVAADGSTRSTGDVWRFRTLAAPARAGLPTPFNGATDVAASTTLTWAAADRADSYDVYFGTDMTNPPFQGNQVSRSYSPGALIPNTTYYWRIDTVNESGTTTGTLWSFTVAP